MSLKKRFEGKGSDLGAAIEQRSRDSATEVDSTGAAARPRTGPGQLLAFRTEMVSVSKEMDDMRDRLKAFEGAQPVRLLDPTRIRLSSFANRHPESFAGEAFEHLKQDIATTGGNVQPIKVRPVVPSSSTVDYEVVFGSRRHRACLELGLPVSAQIQDATDIELFLEMERENRARADLTPYEQGLHYKRALDQQLWSSQRKLAEALGLPQSTVSTAITLASLPEPVVLAFPSPLSLQFRWAKDLAETLQREPDRVVATAERLASERGKHSAKDVLEALLGHSKPGKPERLLHTSLGQAGRMQVSKSGVSIVLDRLTLTESEAEKLQKLLEQFLEKRLSAK